MRVARARELVAEGDQATAAARIAQISRQAIYKTPQRRPPAAGPGRPGADDAAIVEIAKAHPTDGTRMVAAIASRQLGELLTGSGHSGSCAPIGFCSRRVVWDDVADPDTSG